MGHNHKRPNKSWDVPLGSEVVSDTDERGDRKCNEQITETDECAGPSKMPSELPTALEPYECQQRENSGEEIHSCSRNSERLRNTWREIRNEQSEPQGPEHLWRDPETQAVIF